MVHSNHKCWIVKLEIENEAKPHLFSFSIVMEVLDNDKNKERHKRCKGERKKEKKRKDYL